LATSIKSEYERQVKVVHLYTESSTIYAIVRFVNPIASGEVA